MKHLFNTLMICLVATGMAFACPPSGEKTSEAENTEASSEVKFASLNLNITGMTCGGCENKVKAVLSGIDGIVETKKVCSKSDYASLTYDPNVVSEESIMQVLTEKTGYTIAVVKNAGMTEKNTDAEASVKKACSSAKAKKACSSAKAAKSSCGKSKASADKDLEKVD